MSSNEQGGSGKGDANAKKRKAEELKTREGGSKVPREDEGLTGAITAITAIQARTSKLESDFKSMKADVADGKRQYTKRCLVLSGKAIPQAPKRREDEDSAALFVRICKEKYGVEVDVGELGDVHRNARGLVAEFSNRKQGSAYDRLLHRFGNWNPNPSMDIHLNIATTPYDGRIRYVAGRLKKEGLIEQYHIDKSGKIRIRRSKEEGWNSISDMRDIEKMIPAELKKKMDQEDKERAEQRKAQIRRGGRPSGRKATGSNATALGDTAPPLSETDD